MHSSQHIVELPPAYDLKRSLGLLTMGRSDPAVQVNVDSVDWALMTPDGPVALHAEQNGNSLDVTITGSDSDWLKPHLPALFGLNDSPGDFQPTGPLGEHVRRFSGVHLPRLPDIFPRLIQIVLQQLVSWEDAAGGWGRMVRRYGEPTPGDTDLTAPPTPQTLRSLAYYDLVACGILPKQARLVLRLATEHRRIQRAAEKSEAVLCRLLYSIPGIGPWTVDYLRGSALGNPDAVLTGDYALPHTVSWFFRKEPRSTDEEMLGLLEPFRGHRFRVQHLLMTGGISPPRRGPKMATNQRRFGL